MDLPNSGQVAAFGRHVASYAAGAITAGAVLHIISSGDASTLSDSLSKISTGVADIAAGVAPIVAMISGIYAAWSASHKSQVTAVVAAVASGSIPKAATVNAIQDARPDAKGL